MRVLNGPEAIAYGQRLAIAWAAAGDTRLAARFEAHGVKISGSPSARSTPSGAPSFVIVPTDPATDPSDPRNPNNEPAQIYWSSTDPAASASTGYILSSVKYYGNWAENAVTFRATDANGGTVVPSQTVRGNGMGSRACSGWSSPCIWTYQLNTSVSVQLGNSCGVTLYASGTHTAMWQWPGTDYLQGYAWGQAYSAEGDQASLNCAPTKPSVCTDPSATNYNQAPPCTYPPPSGGGDQSGGGQPPSDPPPPPEPNYPPRPGHYECVIWYQGTDYEQEKCTWYENNDARIPSATPVLSRQS